MAAKVKTQKTQKKEKKEKKTKTRKSGKESSAAKAGYPWLLADARAVDQNLASLFAHPAPVTPRPTVPAAAGAVEVDGDNDETDEAADVGGGVVLDGDDARAAEAAETAETSSVDIAPPVPRKKRKRREADEELEGVYLERLAHEEQKNEERAAAERATKRQKNAGASSSSANDAKEDRVGRGPAQAGKDGHHGSDDDDDGVGGSDDDNNDEDEGEGDGDDEEEGDGDDGDAMSPPPKHETLEAAEVEFAKANRTVFLGNVATTAISSKSARKTLQRHLESFFDAVPHEDGPPHKVESMRFRSTPYASAVPKKAAYARKELMDATTKSTNAYVVYSSPRLARAAARRLNGSVVLDRHLRVDEVAHPAPTDHRRCVFVGNLGFVDDESNIQDANEQDGREKRKRAKEPADVEEGLWRTFARCGAVESVRVVRDPATRVGKGIAYVQFADANGVEAALLYDGKKFPPLLPRKLRVSRAKAPKRHARRSAAGRPGSAPTPSIPGYQRKVSGEEASRIGRAGKLLGRAAVQHLKPRAGIRTGQQDGITKPEHFVFEGHRASRQSGSAAGLKLGGRKKKARMPTSRSAKWGAAQKKGGQRNKAPAS